MMTGEHMPTLWSLMQDCIPNDHARQVSAIYYLDEAMTAPDAPDLVVDLGCGRATSAGLFRRHNPKVRWIGIDVGDSPEGEKRIPSGDCVVIYDGVRLPLGSNSVPLIFSKQVFEHVRDPRELLLDIARALQPGGQFIGSTSQLEPYHSLSLWNYTPYGFRVLVEEAGLRLEEIRPSIDGITLIKRAYFGRPPEYGRYFRSDSPLNVEIDEWGRETGRRPALVNLRKLTFCGHFAFRVRKPR
jgi:SAM-dependent methyltransferase